MDTLLTNPIFVALAVAIAVFVVVYTQLERTTQFFQSKKSSSESEMIDRLDRMLMDVDRKKLGSVLNFGAYGFGAIAFLLVWPNLLVGGIMAVATILLTFHLPKIVINNLWEKRCNQIVSEMVDGLTLMTNSIKAGQSVTQAMERVVENSRGPLAQEFGVILNKVRLGMSMEDALVEFAEKIQRPDTQMMVTAIVVLKETGGNLAETFATIASTIRERQKIEKKIQALTAQGQMQAIIISAVPFVLLGVFASVDPNYIMPMFTRPLGWFFLALMLALQTIGLVVMKRIITIKV